MHTVPERVPQETEVIGSVELPKEIAKDITGDEVLRVGARVYVRKTSINDENHIFAIPIDGNPNITDEEELAVRDTLSPQDTDIVVSFPNRRKLFSAIPVDQDTEIKPSRFAYTLDLLRQQEADLLSEPFIPPSVITSQIFPNHTRKDMADIVYGRAEDDNFNSTSYWEYVDRVIDRLLLDAPEFMQPYVELGIIDQLKSHLPDEGIIETGGKYNARYKWKTNAGGFNQGVYTFDGNKNTTTPNIAIPRKAPSPLHILLSMTSGNFPRPINTLTEEVCHAFQHRDGLSLVTPLLLEAQAKRLHNESPPRLRDHETRAENSSGRIVDYNYTQVTGDYLVQHFRSYGYKRAYVSWEHVVEDLRDYLTRNNLSDFMRTIPIAARAMTVGTRQENIDDKKARYVNESYDKLRAMNISESSLASLASFPGKWQNGTFSRIEETITRWMKHYDYTEADINALIEAELLRNRVGQLLMRKYAQEEFEKIFGEQSKYYPLSLAPDTKLVFDHK